MEKRGVSVICSGSDGDNRFLKSQKSLVDFGNFQPFGKMILAGNIAVENLASQDALHDAKKMKNVFYDPCEVLLMGTSKAALGHLVTLMKKFDKNSHNLTLSDLDPTDRMNYE